MRIAATTMRRAAATGFAAAGAATAMQTLCATQCDSSSSLMRAGKLNISTSMGGRGSQLVTVQGTVHTATLAAQDVLLKHLAGFQAKHWEMLSAVGIPTTPLPEPLSISLTADQRVMVEFPLPKACDATAVLASTLNVNSLVSTEKSTPLQKMFGDVTIRDAMESAEYEMADGIHQTTVKTEAGDVKLLRDLMTGEASLRFTATQLKGAQARALARAYEMAHDKAQLPGPGDEVLSPGAADDMAYCGGSV